MAPRAEGARGAAPRGARAARRRDRGAARRPALLSGRLPGFLPGLLLALAVLAPLGAAAPARAQEEEAPPPAAPVIPAAPPVPEEEGPSTRWSVGITAGTYTPRLRQLNEALATSGLVLLQDPNFLIPRNQDLPATTRDVAVPELSGRASYGVELQWQLRERVGLVFMLLNWEGNSSTSDTITMALRSNLPPVDVPRTARYNLNLNQFWVGWRYSVFDRPGQGRIFVNIGLAGLAVADFTMDALLKVQPGPGDPVDLSFASISSTEVHGTAYSSRYGVGGEYFLTPKISFGFHVNYIFGAFSRFRVSRYFASGFSELPPIPPETTNSLPDNVLPTNHALPVVGDQVQTATISQPRDAVEIVENPTDVNLDLRGYEVSAMIRVYY